MAAGEPPFACDVDDFGVFCLAQVWDCVFAAKKDAFEVDGEHVIPCFLRSRLNRAFGHDACIVDEDVDAFVFFDRGVDHAFDAG